MFKFKTVKNDKGLYGWNGKAGGLLFIFFRLHLPFDNT